MPRPRWRVEVRQKFLVDATCLAFLTLIIVTITSLYVASEHNFHWWIDWYASAIRVATAFRESPSQGIELVQQSLVQERNRIYTLPLVPFILAFGSSRLVYELSLALVYLLPFALVMGGIATQLIRAYPQTVFWSTALLTLLIPVSWVPTFMGIPDTGGALLIALAVLVYLQDVRLKRWWRIPLIGFLLGLGILLRRHFIYGSIAFLGALTLQALIFFLGEVRQISQKGATASRIAIAGRNLLGYGVRIGLIAAMMLVTLVTVAPEFTHNALTINYRNLYTSWSLPFSDLVNLYGSFYGWATWLIVVIGFSAAVKTRSVTLPALSFIGLMGVFSLIAWVVVLRYANVFYSLHITPLVVIGLVAFLWTAWIRLTGKVRTLILAIVGCYLVSNLVIGLTPIGSMSGFFRPLYALSIPPLVRTDYDEVARLIKYLRQLAPNQEPIYVVGYQRLQLTSGLVKGAEFVLHGRDNRILNVLPAPEVDSRDTYPLETLLQAQYVVVPNPLPPYPGSPTKVPAIGEWLPTKENDVVKVAFDAFTQNWGIAQDFKRLPIQFTLEKNAVVSIYQRTRPTSVETAVRTLYAMQQQIGEQPGGQLDWMILSQGLSDSSVGKNSDNTYRLVSFPRDRSEVQPVSVGKVTPPKLAQPSLAESPASTRNADGTQGSATSLLYLGSLPEKAEVTGAVTYLDKPCVRTSLRLTMLNQEGQIVSSTKNEYAPKDSSRFKVAIRRENSSAYLLLDVLTYDDKDLVTSCTLEINSLALLNQ